jgi:hypothetical protein
MGQCGVRIRKRKTMARGAVGSARAKSVLYSGEEE